MAAGKKRKGKRMGQETSVPSLKERLLIIVCVCGVGKRSTCPSVRLEVRGQLSVDSLLPPLCKVLGLNLDLQACIASTFTP